jgi:multidrug efflux pump subunit AcrA (membrane-fusion protein)
VFSVTDNQPVKKGQVIAELDGQVDATTPRPPATSANASMR